MTDTAQLFVVAEHMNDYEILQALSTDEVDKSLNSAEHTQLSVIQNIVNWLRIKSEHKYPMYAPKIFRELREKYKVYETLCDNIQKENSRKMESKTNKNNANNCSSTEH